MDKTTKNEETRANDKSKAGNVPTYGLLTINHAYNEGKLTFMEWMQLSREWSLAMTEQYGSKQQKERAV
jgi:hypothetical protein